MAPKKKAQKMALADFFAETPTGSDSWADEMPALPSAPAPRDPTLPRKGEAGYLDSMPDRSSRPSFTGGPPRDELPLPDVPPFTAFVGNLTFETDEEALRDFFTDLTPSSVRLVKDATGKAKGFGYVEFPSRDKLKDALDRNMTQMMGRTIRISVAEAPTTSRSGYGTSAAETADQWRRSTPLPAREAPTPARRQPSYNDAGAGGGPERDWGAARGARFTPSVPPTPSGLGREHSGPGREREYREPSAADEVDQWRSSRPLVAVNEGAGRDARSPIAQTSPSLADTESTWSRATKLRTPVASEPPRSSTASPGEDKDWRSSRAPSAVPSVDGESPRQAPPAPLERRKLNLAPRSTQQSPTTSAPSSTSGDTKGIFGNAKPVDSAAREKEAEAKLAQREEERRKAREEEFKRQKEEADKGRQLAEEKAKQIKEAQAKAAAEISGTAPPAPARGDAPRRGRGGPPQHQQPHQHQQHRRRSSQDKKPVVGEDGFEVATRGAKARTEDRAAPTRKESTTRQGFSFAAAAGSFGVDVDEVEEEATNGGVNGGVESVTNGVKEVTV